MNTQRPHAKAALLVVDMQRDFCAGGALEVARSERVIDAVNAHIADAVARTLPVYASRDWHPPTTTHFKEFGGEWPTHCVKGSQGAEFHPDLRLPSDVIIVTKGERDDAPGYSAFEGVTPSGRTLLADLRERGITHLYVGGLATDYCVRASVLDALESGLTVSVLEDAVAGVDVRAGDSDRAREEMRVRGAEFTSRRHVQEGGDLTAPTT